MIATARLTLRRFTAADAPDVQRLAGTREVALNTLRIPYPYPAGAAEAWIARQQADESEMVFAIEHEGRLIGAIGLVLEREHDRAELGYWIGVPFWGRGFATEAAAAVVRHGFENQELNRIYAQVFSRNPASSRVLQKIGMRHEGTLRQHVRKWGELVDLECWGRMRDERGRAE